VAIREPLPDDHLSLGQGEGATVVSNDLACQRPKVTVANPRGGGRGIRVFRVFRVFRVLGVL